MNSLSLDFIIRVKNGYAAGRKSITGPASNFIIAIADLMRKNSLIKDYSVDGDVKKNIKVELQYDNGNPAFSQVKIHSKPGRRLYSTSASLPWGDTHKSLIIVSTSTGVISQKEARKSNIGGEIIAELY